MMNDRKRCYTGDVDVDESVDDGAAPDRKKRRSEDRGTIRPTFHVRSDRSIAVVFTVSRAIERANASPPVPAPKKDAVVGPDRPAVDLLEKITVLETQNLALEVRMDLESDENRVRIAMLEQQLSLALEGCGQRSAEEIAKLRAVEGALKSRIVVLYGEISKLSAIVTGFLSKHPGHPQMIAGPNAAPSGGSMA